MLDARARGDRRPEIQVRLVLCTPRRSPSTKLQTDIALSTDRL